jgi:D-glycero-D-manno-heptose 1,7-bisphosphate phosphatase
MDKNKAVFLDRDGTINVDYGYLNHSDQMDLITGAGEAIKKLNEAGYKVIVVSNQAGIARGLASEDQVQSCNKTLQKKVLNEGGIIDAIYYCPHHPEHGTHPYKKKCDCRKPEPGQVQAAEKKFNLDLSKSFMVGDKTTDIELGKNAGLKTVFVLTGKGEGEEPKLAEKKLKPDHKAPSIVEAIEWILSKK